MSAKYGRRQFLKLSGVGAVTALTTHHTVVARGVSNYQSVTTHRFAVNIPNPESVTTNVHLRLEPAQPTDLEVLYLEVSEPVLDIIDVGIAYDFETERGDAELELNLEPNSSIDVYVLISVNSSGQPGIAAFNLIDERGGAVVGGVLLVVTDPPIVEPFGQQIPALNPCMAVLETNTYWIAPGDDPSLVPSSDYVPRRTRVEFVAPIINPTSDALINTQVYLESLGECNGDFESGTWNIGTMEPGQVFYATWHIQIYDWRGGIFYPSIVVMSDGTEPVRLDGTIDLGEEIRINLQN